MPYLGGEPFLPAGKRGKAALPGSEPFLHYLGGEPFLPAKKESEGCLVWEGSLSYCRRKRVMAALYGRRAFLTCPWVLPAPLAVPATTVAVVVVVVVVVSSK